MKKVLLAIITLFLFTNIAYAENISGMKTEGQLVNVEGVNSISIELNDKVTPISLIAYNKEDGELNKEIDEYIINRIKNATKLEIEVDPYSSEYDKYNRKLVWLYIDDTLLQKELIEKGYGQVDNINGTYNYLDELCNIQLGAIKSTVGIWKYPNIKESYCNSGINLDNIQNEDKKEDEVNKNENHATLKYMLFLSSGILCLLIILRGKNGKR